MTGPPLPVAALRFDGLIKRYGRREVLKGLSLEVADGEFFGLVGMNGAGKTTCIKCLLEFCDVHGGKITIFARSHTERLARSRLAYLPERFLPPYYLTGRDFLKYMSRLQGERYDDARVRSICGTLDLAEEALGRSVRDYSKGMAQKLGLAACFLGSRDLIVLDEPMSGLDPKARILVKRYLLELKTRGHSLFFSTHLLADVADICDRMGILHEGVLRFVGTPEACCETYAADNLEEAYLNCIAEPEARGAV